MNCHNMTLMGGQPGAICIFCFVAWYEEGLTQDDAIRRRSIALREEGWV
jgi:hypothetical protein